MKIKTSSGNIFDIRVICAGLRNKNTVLIEVYDDRPLAQIAADFDGLESFIRYDEGAAGIHETYEGFSSLISMQRNAEAGTVRLMMERRENG